MSKDTSAEIKWTVSGSTDSQPIIKIGVWSIGLVLVLFLIWGAVFQLSSAVITPGTLVSDGKNKLIQHPVGGRVRNLFVREGDYLEKGQIVLELDPTQAQADLSKLNARHASLAALKNRLDVERKDMGLPPLNFSAKTPSLALRGSDQTDEKTSVLKETIGLRGTTTDADFDPMPTRSVENSDTPVITLANSSDEIVTSQQDAFRSGRMVLNAEIEGLRKKADTLMRQMNGVRARIDSQKQLRELTREELKRLQPLARKGYVARNRLSDVKGKLVEFDGAIKAAELEALSFENQIEEVRVQINKARVVTSDAASREYARIVAELAELADQRHAAMEQVKNMVVRAPVSGRLTNLVVTTVGGVFGGGDVVGQIVPDGSDMLVEARVQPSDIDFVKVGQEAEVAVTAFNRRLDDTLDARVVYVSADSERDDQTSEQYFIARLKLVDDPDTQEGVRLSDVRVGMQGEVYINTGSRTFLTYAGKPLIDSFRRAFRER